MPLLERDGAQLHYRVEGSGAPVLLIHSATSTGTYEWDALVQRLRLSYRCIVPDLRSHGSSDHVEGALGLDEVVSDLRSLIAQVDLGRPHVVGFSFGAEVALEMEIHQPGTAQSLILVSPGTGHSDGVPQVEKMAVRWPRSLRELHTSKHGPNHWRTILETLSDDASNRAQVADDVLSGIDCPMLLVVGSEDQPIRVGQALRLAELNSRARLVTMDGVGHAAHAADPDTFADVAGDFLASVGIESR
jgi:pimeloyl-ACP methyl ester carboxylesterase